MTTKRIARPGENVSLSQMYGWGAWAMWFLSSVATAFAANPLMVKIAARVGYSGDTGEAVGLGLAILFGFGLQWSITIAERPVLRFNLSPLVLFALANLVAAARLLMRRAR
ncbi:hypothetical protein SE17_17120 [Kouleothrix aurantiaca]|uniref:Uncharacterized protein n=1 Tax=Kouleothrix aurantiaca TaxID=186479 RepID=A0A0P9CZY5_9CHLR|nr:hypothetical protein SE17_17120 [Kouleothrix aurantiaca]